MKIQHSLATATFAAFIFVAISCGTDSSPQDNSKSETKRLQKMAEPVLSGIRTLNKSKKANVLAETINRILDSRSALVFDQYLVWKPWGAGRVFSGIAPFSKKRQAGEAIGEAVMVSGMESMPTLFQGKSLKEMIDLFPERVLGSAFVKKTDLQDLDGVKHELPVYMKILDAKDDLSIQVHPDDLMARKLGMPFGKSESWIIHNAEPGSGVYLGFKPGVTEDQVKALLEQAQANLIKDESQIKEVLNFVEVKPGDVLDIPAGLVHAVGRGVQIVEPQQSSNTTYRLFDKVGSKRELHVRLGLEALNFDPNFNSEFSKPVVKKGRILLDNDIYSLITFTESNKVKSVQDRYRIVTPLKGSVTIDGQELEFGRSAIILPGKTPDIIYREKGAKLLVVTPKA